MERIYLDNAATTRVRPEAVQAALPIMTEIYGNPSSIHSFGREAKKALEKARCQVAAAIGAKKGKSILPPAVRNRITGRSRA